MVEGNAFRVVIPLKRLTFESCKPIEGDIDYTQLTDVVVKYGGVDMTVSIGMDGVSFISPATQPRGTFDIVLTAKYQGTDIRAAYEGAITIVAWNSQSDAQQFVPGSPLVLDAAYVIGGALTDAELEALKALYVERNAQLAQAIADAEAVKAAFDAKAEALDDVAQQSTLMAGVVAIRDDISHVTIDTSTLAKQGTNASATLTDTQTAAWNAATDAASIKNAVGTSADTSSVTTTLFGWIKSIKEALVAFVTEMTTTHPYATEANATQNKSDIIAAVQANAGVPTETIPSTTASKELAPNVLYVFSERSTNLTLTLGTPIVGKANEYHLFLVTGSNAPTVTWPAGISWNGGSAPTIAASKTYEVSILNNVAAFMEV